MPRKKCCCVPGCEDQESVRHRIPILNNTIYNIWLRRISNPKLFELTKESVNRNYVICNKHFIDDCKNPSSRRLQIYSLPSINLPGFNEEGNRSNSFAYPPVSIPIQLVGTQTHHAEDDHKMNVDVDHILPPSLIKEMILDDLRYPVVFRGHIFDWEMLGWSPQDWVKHLGDKKLPFRRGQKKVTEWQLQEGHLKPPLLCCKRQWKKEAIYYPFHLASGHTRVWSHTNHALSDVCLDCSPQWERGCSTEQLTMAEFFLEDTSDSWLYFDYKYMHEWFQDHPNILQAVSWANLGFPERTGSESTMWIGSSGAHTPCHIDTYGCNIVAQVMGRKQWILFPPSAPAMLPTRVPYEESSIYSNRNFYSPGPDMAEEQMNHSTIAKFINDGLKVLWSNSVCEEKVFVMYSDTAAYMIKAATALKVFSPNLIHFTCLPHALQHTAEEVRELTQARVVTLNPGDVLFVPHHWWHYVENITTAVSINTWISLDYLPDLPLSVSLSQVDTCVNLCHKIKEEAPESPDKATQISNSPTANKKPKRDCTSYVDVLSQYGDNVMVVPVCPYVELKTLLSKKREALLNHITDTNKYSSQSSLKQTAEENSQSLREDILARHMVNAFCHPETILLVKQKLLESKR
uniref:JmjC domain-containing protein n=1 Tax=Timema douglasi TaxID=61478 RepID=A0A7R8VQ37_TIMDO|nr:unnamed protein product [Timema douglasi]